MQRVLAARGVASRRKAEDLIRAGRVQVDGVTVTELGVRVNPTADIRLDGRAVRSEAPRYILLNKPAGFITTTSDEKGRDTVMSLIGARERVYPVGRLDRETEGLLLLTNDGDVAHRVMHPRYKLAKEYTILTATRPPEAVMLRVRSGVEVDRRKVVPDEFRILRETRDGVLLTITVHEGLNRVVRRMMEEVGVPVARLRRVRIGPLSIGSIPSGGSRDLSGGELTSLLQALRLDEADSPHVGAAAKSGRPKPAARHDGSKAPGRRSFSGRKASDGDERKEEPGDSVNVSHGHDRYPAGNSASADRQPSVIRRQGRLDHVSSNESASSGAAAGRSQEGVERGRPSRRGGPARDESRPKPSGGTRSVRGDKVTRLDDAGPGHQRGSGAGGNAPRRQGSGPSHVPLGETSADPRGTGGGSRNDVDG